MCSFYLGHIACLPPSTGSEAPVMYDESLDARNAMTLATSSTCPGRPKAWVCLHRSKNWIQKSNTISINIVLILSTQVRFFYSYLSEDRKPQLFSLTDCQGQKAPLSYLMVIMFDKKGRRESYGLFIWRRVVRGRRVTLHTELTFITRFKYSNAHFSPFLCVRFAHFITVTFGKFYFMYLI